MRIGFLQCNKNLTKFGRNKVSELVTKLNNHPIIRTKWVYGNKQDGAGVNIKNRS